MQDNTPVSKKPVPVADELTRPYWEAANEGRLAIQRCQGCSRYYHPPVAICSNCHSEDLSYQTVSGKGTLYTFTITHDARTPAFAALQPYAVVWVELDEQPGLMMMTNMPDTDLKDVRIGERVEVSFEQIGPGSRIPQFRLAKRA